MATYRVPKLDDTGKLKPKHIPDPATIGAATAAQGAKADTATQPADLTAGLAGKQDKATLGADVAADTTVRAAFGTVVTPEAYGAKGDGTTDDTAALQAAINAAVAARGTLLLGPSVYRTTATLNITGSCTVTGAGAFEVYGSGTSLINDNMPTVAPYLRGSVILVDAAATDAVKIGTAVAPVVNLRDFGIRFNDAYRWTNTGHGVVMTPPALNTWQDHGVFSSKWSGVKVYGHDGNHYAFVLVNSMYSTMENLRGYGGGLIRFYQNSSSVNYGNTVFIHPMGVVMCNGTAQGIFLETNPSYTGQLLNLITLIRPQVWIQDTSATTGITAPAPASQLNLNADNGSARIKYCTIIHADFERSNGSGSPIWPWNLCNIVGGGIMPFSGTNNIQVSPTSGTIYQNTSGSMALYKTAWDLTAQAGAAASILCEISGNSDMSGAAQASEFTVPAATAGTWRKTCTFAIPAGYYFRLTVANGTRAWARFDRISGI